MSKIVGIGETVLDVIFKNDKPQEAVPGGSTFNAMISLGRTVGKKHPEVPIIMVTETGDDHIGDIVTSFMKVNGVSTDAVTQNPGTQTHISMAFLNDRNDAQYEFYKDHAHASLNREKLEGIKFCKDDFVLFGSFFAINPVIREFTLPLLREARKAGATIYYDINFRKSHMGELDRTMEMILENCALSTWVRGSDEDFGYLFGTSDPEEIYEQHIRQLCPNFICTCGSKPVHLFTPEGHGIYPVEKIQTVSTIGAGDNFNAGFIYGLMQKEEPGCAIKTATRFSANVCKSIYNYVDEDFSL